MLANLTSMLWGGVNNNNNNNNNNNDVLVIDIQDEEDSDWLLVDTAVSSITKNPSKTPEGQVSEILESPVAVSEVLETPIEATETTEVSETPLVAGSEVLEAPVVQVSSDYTKTTVTPPKSKCLLHNIDMIRQKKVQRQHAEQRLKRTPLERSNKALHTPVPSRHTKRRKMYTPNKFSGALNNRKC